MKFMKSGKVIILDRRTLTDNEAIVMQMLVTNDLTRHRDIGYDFSYSAEIVTKSKLEARTYRGVVESLIRKGYVEVDNSDHTNSFDTQIIRLTTNGVALYSDEV